MGSIPCHSTWNLLWIRAGISRSTSVSPVSTIPPMFRTLSSTCCSYRKDKRARTEKFNKQCSFVSGPVQLLTTDGPGIECRWRRDLPNVSNPALGPTRPPVQWVPGLSRGVQRPERGLDHPPHLEPRLKKEKIYTSTPPLGLRDLLQGDLYPYLDALL